MKKRWDIVTLKEVSYYRYNFIKNNNKNKINGIKHRTIKNEGRHSTVKSINIKIPISLSAV
jgi:hypothetical protein